MIPFCSIKSQLTKLIYPIGSIYMSVNNTNPSELFGGTWVAWGSGKVPVGVNIDDSDFDTVEKSGGEKTHKLTVDEMPSHGNHLFKEYTASGTLIGKFLNPDVFSDYNNFPRGWNSFGGEAYPNGNNLGGNQAHNNLQPYITCYMWKRTG